MPTPRQNRAAVELAKALTDLQEVKNQAGPANAQALGRVLRARRERNAAAAAAEKMKARADSKVGAKRRDNKVR
jgi:hypothetical protein